MRTFFLLLLILFVSSCRTVREVEKEYVYKTDTIHTYSTRVDSVIQNDSVYIKEFVKGDTVIIDRYKYKYIYKPSIQHDSVYICKTDTVVKEVKVQEKPTISKWQVAVDVLFVLLIVAFLGSFLTAWVWKNTEK